LQHKDIIIIFICLKAVGSRIINRDGFGTIWRVGFRVDPSLPVSMKDIKLRVVINVKTMEKEWQMENNWSDRCWQVESHRQISTGNSATQVGHIVPQSIQIHSNPFRYTLSLSAPGTPPPAAEAQNEMHVYVQTIQRHRGKILGITRKHRGDVSGRLIRATSVAK